MQGSNHSIIPLESILYPFCDAGTVTEDIILIPSKGTFLEDFNSQSGLHVAIRGSEKSILEFDHNGMKTGTVDEVRWHQCVKLQFVENFFKTTQVLKSNDLTEAWSTAIGIISDKKITHWSREKYDLVGNNCFDFVMTFLKEFLTILSRLNHLSDHISSNIFKLRDKILFCEYFIIPETRRVAEYLNSYRRIKLTQY